MKIPYAMIGIFVATGCILATAMDLIPGSEFRSECSLNSYNHRVKTYDQVRVTQNGQKQTLPLFSMCLTDNQEQLLGNPQSLLRQAASTLSTAHQDGVSIDCDEAQKSVNNTLLQILTQQVREKVGEDQLIKACQHAIPVSGITSKGE